MVISNTLTLQLPSLTFRLVVIFVIGNVLHLSVVSVTSMVISTIYVISNALHLSVVVIMILCNLVTSNALPLITK